MASEEMAQVSANERTTSPSTLPPGDLFITLKNWYLADKAHWSEWYTEAKDAFDFVAGHGQWKTDERQFLLSEAGGKRQPITFNLVLTFIKAVCGIEIGSRHDIVYLPRRTEPGVVKKNELLSGASDYMADEANAGKAESRAFQDAVKCGMGFLETGLDYDTDPDGAYKEERINPLEMLVDNKARKDNCLDARRMFHVKSDIPLAEARAMFPDINDDAALDAHWAKLGPENEDPKPKEERMLREENSGPNDEKQTVTIIRAQWWEREPYVRAVQTDPQTGQPKIVDVDMAQWKMLEKVTKKAKGELPKHVKQTRKVYKQAWIGSELLKVEAAPCKDHFSWKVITGEPDESKGVWYGLVRVVHDAQKFCNKWMTQYLHILNSTAKGGVMYEDDAIDDLPEFLDSYAQVDKPTKVARGAISGSKITPKPGVPMGAEYMKMAEFAISMIPKLLGIPIELIGLREVNQPGVLEAQRKQAGMTILATLFDSLKQARKAIGQTRLYFIQTHLADGRWVRIAGEDGQQYLPLVKDQVAGRYDVIVEDAPTSPNQKEQTWALLQPIIPMFKEDIAANPDLLGIILEYSPLPTKFTESLKQLAKKPNPQAEKQAQIAEQAAVAKIDVDKSTAEKNRATAKKTDVDALVAVLEAGFESMRAKREKKTPIKDPNAQPARQAA